MSAGAVWSRVWSRGWPQALALTAGGLGGWAAEAAGVPLGWLIGAMLANVALALSGAPVATDPRLRRVMIAVLGVMLGSAFSPEILQQLQQWALSLVVLVVYTLVVAVAGMLWCLRVARLDSATAYFSGVPGGLSEMLILGPLYGADPRVLSLTHGTRVILLVTAIPALLAAAGFVFAGTEGAAAAATPAIGPLDALLLLAALLLGPWLAARLRVPAAPLFGALVLSAAVHLAGWTEVKPPEWAIAAAQVVIGASAGAYFLGATLRLVVRSLLFSLGLTSMMLAVAALFALFIVLAAGVPFAAAFLALVPGGLAEMSLVALALGVEPAYVSAHHLVRIFLVMALVPPAFALWRRLTTQPKEPE